MKQADNPFGVLYRRLRSRLGPAQATVATVHAIARVVYKMLKYKVEYDPLSVNEYQQKYDEQKVKYMRKKAAKLGFQPCAELVEASSRPEGGGYNNRAWRLDATPDLRLTTCRIYGYSLTIETIFLRSALKKIKSSALRGRRFLRTNKYGRMPSFYAKETMAQSIMRPA
ncbi:MAG: hypothetical protein IT314_10270 [Anaerolineales bacterium]|nr:hypothetical protein [Anaerolineales bacterium]